MTVTVSTNSVTWTGNAATTAFPYSFALPAASNATVLLTTAAGVQTTVPPGAYTLTGVGQPTAGGGPQGGVLSYAPGGLPIPAGSLLTLIRTVPDTQPTSLSNQGGAWPAVIEGGMDILEMQLQQIANTANRAIVVNPADGPATPLPVASARASQFMMFDAYGNPTTGLPVAQALVSTPMQPVTESVTTAAALALLGGTTAAAALAAGQAVLPFVTPAGLDPTGVADCTAILNAALAVANANVWLGPGTYKILGTLTITASGVTLRGAGQYGTVLSFANGASDCITFTGTAGTYVNGNAVRDLSITGVGKTGGRAIYFTFATNWMVERCYFNNVWNGVEAYVINTGTMRNCTMAGVTNPAGWGIFYHAPGDGSYRSDELNLHDVVVNCLYSGAKGLVIDGWANTVNAYQFVALDVSYGLQVLNDAGSASYYPTYGEFINSVVDGASVRSVEINAGQVWRFTGCEIGNNSGSSGQGGADNGAFVVGPDTGHSETSQIYVVNCNIGGCVQSAVTIASHDNTFVACTFYQGITSPGNTWSSVTINSPASDTTIIGCKNSYYGDPNDWSYGITMNAGSFRTLVVGCNFNIGSRSAAINNLSGDSNTFANDYIGAPATAGTGPVVTFPQYIGAPATPALGETYFNTTTKHCQTWDGTAWNNLW